MKNALLACLLAAAAPIACSRGTAAATTLHPDRKTPICAVQDCATGKVVDNGCTDDGRCASCMNACAPPPTSR